MTMYSRNYHEPGDKGILFLSMSAAHHAQHLFDAGVSDILISYHYLRKQSKYREIVPEITARGGYFMTDSGAFSIMMEIMKNGGEEAVYDPNYWEPYIEEYVGYIYDNLKYIYVCVNMDLDNLVGREPVDRWNEKYFEPLQKHTNVIFLAQKDKSENNYYGDRSGMKRLHEYCSKYSYVGVNNYWQADVRKVYAVARTYGVKIHGFALTGIKDLTSTPFFSHDSTSWLSGAKFGTTYRNIGKNFYTYDKKRKWKRKAMKGKLVEAGVDWEGLEQEVERDVNVMNATAWNQLRLNYLKSANLKLVTKPALFYDQRKNVSEH